MKNINKGTSDVNRQYSQVYGNRSTQLNLNCKGKKLETKYVLVIEHIFIFTCFTSFSNF